MRTTIPFAQWLLAQPRFVAGDFSTDFIAEEWHPEPRAAAEAPAHGAAPFALDERLVAMVAAALAAEDMGARADGRQDGGATTGEAGSRWRDAGRLAALRPW